MRRTQCRPKVPCLTPPFHPSSRSIRTEPAMHKAVLLEKPARNCKLCGEPCILSVKRASPSLMLSCGFLGATSVV
jgi:hypothetical protein